MIRDIGNWELKWKIAFKQMQTLKSLGLNIIRMDMIVLLDDTNTEKVTNLLNVTCFIWHISSDLSNWVFIAIANKTETTERGKMNMSSLKTVFRFTGFQIRSKVKTETAEETCAKEKKTPNENIIPTKKKPNLSK